MSLIINSNRFSLTQHSLCNYLMLLIKITSSIEKYSKAVNKHMRYEIKTKMAKFPEISILIIWDIFSLGRGMQGLPGSFPAGAGSS